jgi:hypothetical protein
MRWKTISVLVPLIRVSKRLMTGWMSNWLTFSVPPIKPRHNTLLKTGSTTVSEVSLTLVLTDTYITLMLYINR